MTPASPERASVNSQGRQPLAIEKVCHWLCQWLQLVPKLLPGNKRALEAQLPKSHASNGSRASQQVRSQAGAWARDQIWEQVQRCSSSVFSSDYESARRTAFCFPLLGPEPVKLPLHLMALVEKLSVLAFSVPTYRPEIDHSQQPHPNAMRWSGSFTGSGPSNGALR